ncbi:MAG: hypothetical protein U0136_13350 [Bdellovibrionota bacterium]
MANFEMPERTSSSEPRLAMPAAPLPEPLRVAQSLLQEASLGDTLRVPPRPEAKDAAQTQKRGDRTWSETLSNNAHTLSAMGFNSGWSGLKSGFADLISGAKELNAGKTLRAASETIGAAAGTVLGAAAYVPSYAASWAASQGLKRLETGEGKWNDAMGIGLIAVGAVAGYAGVVLQSTSFAATTIGRRLPDLVSALPAAAATVPVIGREIWEAGKTLFGAVSESFGSWMKGRQAESK